MSTQDWQFVRSVRSRDMNREEDKEDEAGLIIAEGIIILLMILKMGSLLGRYSWGRNDWLETRNDGGEAKCGRFKKDLARSFASSVLSLPNLESFFQSCLKCNHPTYMNYYGLL